MRVLVAGIGNIFFGDDGFGVEVARRLTGRTFPSGVRVGEYGIRGLHLAYELLDGYDALVLIDALPMGEEPGTVAVVEVDPGDVGVPEEAEDGPTLDAHTMSPAAVLGHLSRLGGSVRQVRVLGCEPEVLEEGIGLSRTAQGAVPVAVQLLDEVLDELRGTVER